MKNVITTILVFILLATATLALEDIKYTYTLADTNEVLNSSSTGGSGAVNVTLPNTTFDLKLVNPDNKFSIFVEDLNIDDQDSLNITAHVVDLADQTYTGEFSNVSGTKYRVYYAYAFNVSQLVDIPYDLTLNFSDLSDVNRFFKCDYDFGTNQTDFSSCKDLGTGNSNTKLLTKTETNFSSFLFVDDSSIQASVHHSSGGGGGGGGGSSTTTSIIYVTPTPEGQTVQVHNGDELVILFNDKEYHFAVQKTSNQEVSLKAKNDWFTHRIQIGDEKRMGLESFLSDDIRVSMSIVNSFAVLTFRTIEDKPFLFDLLPPRPRDTGTTPPPVTNTPVITQNPPTQPTTPTAATTTESTPQVPAPESPIGLGTIVAAVLFAVLLIGGFAAWRYKLHMDAAPVAGAASQQPQISPPVGSVTPAEEPVKPAPVVVETKREPVTKPVVAQAKPVVRPELHHEIPKAKLLEVEKFIYHAYSLGFRPEQIKAKLLEKGWPEDVVDYILSVTHAAK